MQFLNSGIFIGQWFGINVRLHITFLFYALFRIQSFGNYTYGIAFVVGLYVCILLHEFGHALAAKWCDGEADEILLWPLGGLAFCRPAFHPTAHLITSAAGPFVSLVLWLIFWGLTFLFPYPATPFMGPSFLAWFVHAMASLNLWLLLFNVCVPAFPMDGGRILRDTIWHFTSAETATRIAVVISQAIGITAIGWAFATWIHPGLVPPLPFGMSPLWALILALFILPQASHERHALAFEGGGTYQFSIRDRLKRGQRKRAFHRAVRERDAEDASQPFHQCHTCGRTEDDDASLEFRVCVDCAHGEEYCAEHLDNHKHVTA